MKVCVTGSTGFVGRALCAHLAESGVVVLPVVRGQAGAGTVSYEQVFASTAEASPLAGATAVLHLAARVHVMNDASSDPMAAYREVNVDMTVRLARRAAAAGVRRFVYVSSVKVNGEATAPGKPFRAADTPRPEDPYGVSKWEAEQALHEIARQTGLEVVVVRPPLVYGPGVKANFASMMRAVRRGLPLPLGAVRHNRRSLVALDNLVDLLVRCIDHPAAPGQTFLASDGEDLSTADLLLRLAAAMHTKPRLIAVPPSLLCLGATLAGKGAMMDRLLGNLQVDISHTRATLGWTPPLTVDQGLRRACMELEK